MSTLTIWYIVLSESQPFEVEMNIAETSAMYVDHLKKIIYDDRKDGVFRRLDAADLTLWKVRNLQGLERLSCLPTDRPIEG